LHLAVFLGGIVDYTGAEDWLHEAVDFVLGEHLVIVFEEGFLGFWADEEGEAFVEELLQNESETDMKCAYKTTARASTYRNSKHWAIIFITPLNHLHRTFTKLHNRPNNGQPAHWTGGDDGRAISASLAAWTDHEEGEQQ